MSNRIFDTPKKTAEAFGDYLMKRASLSDFYHCALSGGSTPKLLFEYLSKQYSDSGLWKRIHFYWGDERCVPPTDNESNFKMAESLLLNNISIPAENIHRVHGESNPEREADRYANELMEYVPTYKGLPVFDMIILGMGEDGHTASIFPNQMALMSSEHLCGVATHPTSGQKRVTFTGHVINSAKEVVFLVTGAGKKHKIKDIQKKLGDFYSYPAAHIFPTEGELNWYMDKEAAALL
ncbi:MAG: 6-phosphogluconolactonase [Marinoscillum sp.]|jgi:6-phosphogluconolactonase